MSKENKPDELTLDQLKSLEAEAYRAYSAAWDAAKVEEKKYEEAKCKRWKRELYEKAKRAVMRELIASATHFKDADKD